jgi:protein SCO1
MGNPELLRRCLAAGGLFLLGLPASLPADVANHDDHDPGNATVVELTSYVVPQIKLVRDSGQTVALQQELDDGRPVIMNFIFTTCETTCPLSSATFSTFERKLGPERYKVHFVSISIDPEQDTPARLRAYAKKFSAGPEWQFYTGTVAASLAAQQAFGAYRGDKMSHAPLTLMRAAPGRPWLRIEGFATPEELLQHYHELLARQ